MTGPSQTTPGPQPVRIVVVGSTGSGKTTLARELAHLHGVAHVELDALNWDPNWTQAPAEVFRQRVAAALEGREGWVVDGNYSRARDLVWPRATHIVWLDFPLRIVLWRLFWRTLRRWWRQEELWNGNRERFYQLMEVDGHQWKAELRSHRERFSDNFLSKDSLFLWAIQTHRRRRREFPALFQAPEHAHIHVVRLRSPAETTAWLKEYRAAITFS